MATTTSGNPQEDPARTQDSTPAPSPGQMENRDQLAEDLGLTPAQPPPQDARARKQEERRAPPAGRADKIDDLAEAWGLAPKPPVPAEVEAPPDVRDLTGGGEECQNPVEMPAKEARPGRSDPALQEAFDAFDGAKLPRPPLTKLTDLTPAEGMEALRNLTRYLERVGEPLAEAVRLLLRDLDGKSFQSFPQTKEFVESLQALLDRIGYAVECPRCEELGRLEAAAPGTAAHGSIRVRHPGRTNHGNRTSVSNFNLRKVEPA